MDKNLFPLTSKLKSTGIWPLNILDNNKARHSPRFSFIFWLYTPEFDLIKQSVFKIKMHVSNSLLLIFVNRDFSLWISVKVFMYAHTEYWDL